MMGSTLVLRRRTRFRHLPGRLAAGSFILNEGLEKLDADDDTAKQLHQAASDAFPRVADMGPRNSPRPWARASSLSARPSSCPSCRAGWSVSG